MQPREQRDQPEPAAPWDKAFWLALPHGLLTGVRLPAQPEQPPEAALQRLHPKEREFAAGLTGLRQMQWVGGRLALQYALRHLRSRRVPFLTRDDGSIETPRHLSVSVAHKRTLAVGMASLGGPWTVGVDLETLEPDRSHLAPRILGEQELEAWQGLPAARRWVALLVHFCTKEAVYKALYPRVRRYVGFREARVIPTPHGTSRVELQLTGGEGPFQVDARYHWLDDHLIASVRLRSDG